MNYFRKEDIKKQMFQSEDASFRTGNKMLPVQPVMSMRFGSRGSDTMRPETTRGKIYDNSRRANSGTNNNVRSAYYSVGGVKKLWCEGEGEK